MVFRWLVAATPFFFFCNAEERWAWPRHSTPTDRPAVERDSRDTGSDFLFDVHFVDLENFQPLARFKVQKFAEVTKFVLGFKCDSSAPQTAAGECFYRLNK